MSKTVVVQISESKLPALKKFVQAASARMRVIKDEEEVMQKLVEEGLKSKTESIALLKAELLKNAALR